MVARIRRRNAVGELVCVCLAEDHGAGFAQLRDTGRVRLRAPVLANLRRGGRGHARHVVEFLYADRDAMQFAAPGAGGNLGFGGPGLRHCAVGQGCRRRRSAWVRLRVARSRHSRVTVDGAKPHRTDLRRDIAQASCRSTLSWQVSPTADSKEFVGGFSPRSTHRAHREGPGCRREQARRLPVYRKSVPAARPCPVQATQTVRSAWERSHSSGSLLRVRTIHPRYHNPAWRDFRLIGREGGGSMP